MFQIPEPKDFSFTLTIPAHKQVCYNSRRIKYKYLTNLQQYHLIEDVLSKIFLFDDEINWVYEQHEDKRLHIHGYIKNSYYEYLFEQIKKFYSDYRINIGQRTMNKIIDIQQTIISIDYWKNYCSKHQDTIIYKSKYQQQEDLSQSLERGAPVQSQTKPIFFKYDDEGLPIISKYPFGMVKIAPNKNKYIVEL